ncbi:YciI family protein [Amycolatopsis sp.]|uniref:YciI family protein n=1 Tax=Amycolatopsis sp. TaxID=37632 RepID=UPI002CB97251|nr:YciI family protein [Amycolatopsis sp.]HVV14693.1 YciI family protein [Amycolatopsis sp.]
MTKYLLTVVQPANAERPSPEALEKIMADVEAWRQELADAGSWVFSGGLHGPETATVLRPKDGEVLVTDGPFTEGKEYVGGLSIIDVPDLDAALEWARKGSLATTLPIEVRPFV